MRAADAPFPHSPVIGERNRRRLAPKLCNWNQRYAEHACVPCGPSGGLAYRELSSSGEAGARGRGSGATRYWHRNSCASCQRDICHSCAAGNDMTKANSLIFCDQCHLL